MKKDIYVLGVHDGHCATACLLKNGEVISCVSEERFVYKKNESGVPIKSIEYCINDAGISVNDLDLVVLASRFMAPVAGRMYSIDKKQKKFDFYQSFYKTSGWLKGKFLKNPHMYNYFYRLFAPYFYKKSIKGRIENLSKILKVPKSKIITQEHHQGHAYTALYASGFIKKNHPFLVMTLDGEGDGMSASVNIYKNGSMNRISQTKNTSSLGLLYGHMTIFLGMRALEHEFKVMGLSAYAKEEYYREIYDILAKAIRVEGMQFVGGINAKHYLDYFKENLECKRFDNLSGAVQKLTEDLVIEWVKNSIEKTGIKDVVFSGGVFMNVKVNKKLYEMKEIKHLYFTPSSGDESLPIGGCYYGYEKLSKSRGISNNARSIEALYLGPDVDSKEIKNYFGDKDIYSISKPKNMPRAVAKLLSEGEIVARCSGKMEWGARALGNRSIMADPTRFDSVLQINNAIKSRDFWMPFAPVIMSDYADEYLINPRKMKSPYMILAYDVKRDFQKYFRATSHQYDKTVRPQIIEREINEEYYDIVKEFQKITGVGTLLNTSFNLHGYPIALGVKEAFDVVSRSDLKYLIIGEYLISKK